MAKSKTKKTRHSIWTKKFDVTILLVALLVLIGYLVYFTVNLKNTNDSVAVVQPIVVNKVSPEVQKSNVNKAPVKYVPPVKK
jgi:hypothetical protein